MSIFKKLLWLLVAGLGAVALGMIATSRGEPLNAVWLVAAAACIFVLGYRFYSRFIAYRVLELDNSRATPAERKGLRPSKNFRSPGLAIKLCVEKGNRPA